MAYFRGSTTPLDNGATWTGATGLSDRHDTVVGMAFADQSGVLHIKQSADGTNWDIDTQYAITANTGKTFSETLVGPYWQVSFSNNSGSNQTLLRISAHTSAAGDD